MGTGRVEKGQADKQVLAPTHAPIHPPRTTPQFSCWRGRAPSGASAPRASAVACMTAARATAARRARGCGCVCVVVRAPMHACMQQQRASPCIRCPLPPSRAGGGAGGDRRPLRPPALRQLRRLRARALPRLRRRIYHAGESIGEGGCALSQRAMHLARSPARTAAPSPCRPVLPPTSSRAPTTLLDPSSGGG